jgi:hypothetical protein
MSPGSRPTMQPITSTYRKITLKIFFIGIMTTSTLDREKKPGTRYVL